MDTDTASRLLREKADNLEALDALKDALARARRRAAATGDYADREWYCRAEAELRRRGRRDQAIAAELRQARRSDTEQRERRFEKRFIAAAKRLLPEEQLQALFAAAESDDAAITQS